MPKQDQGINPLRYQVIPRTLVFITRGNHVLLLKGSPNKRIWANRYNGLGGHIERGEDVLSAAKREVREESGLGVDDLLLCGTVMVDAGDAIGICIFVYKGEYRGGEVFESGEGKLMWLQYPDCLQQDLVEDLPTLLPIVFDFKKGDAPFSAKYEYDSSERLVIRFG